MVELCRKIATSGWFGKTIIGVILFAGVLVGVETYPDLAAAHAGLLHLLDRIVLGIFVLEIVIKMIAEGTRPWRYFLDPWNDFDFLIVAVCFLPIDARYAVVLRLARLLRVLKLVRAVPKLQVLVGALLKSIPSMAWVGLLLLLLFYIYAVAATFMFGTNDPVRFGNLQTSMLTLFTIVTTEGWVDIMNTAIMGCDKFGYDGLEAFCTSPQPWPIGAPIFFISFIIIGTMIVLNLFIGVIMNGMEEARAEKDAEDEERRRVAQGDRVTVGDELVAIEKDFVALGERLARLRGRLPRE